MAQNERDGAGDSFVVDTVLDRGRDAVETFGREADGFGLCGREFLREGGSDGRENGQ